MPWDQDVIPVTDLRGDTDDENGFGHISFPEAPGSPSSTLRCVERVGENVVFNHAGCCNKIAPTGRLINSKHLFLTVLEGGRSGAVARQIQCLGRTWRFTEVPSHCVLPKAPPPKTITFGGSGDTNIHTRGNSKHMGPARRSGLLLGAGGGERAYLEAFQGDREERKGDSPCRAELWTRPPVSEPSGQSHLRRAPLSAGCNWI